MHYLNFKICKGSRVESAGLYQSTDLPGSVSRCSCYVRVQKHGTAFTMYLFTRLGERSSSSKGDVLLG